MTQTIDLLDLADTYSIRIGNGVYEFDDEGLQKFVHALMPASEETNLRELKAYRTTVQNQEAELSAMRARCAELEEMLRREVQHSADQKLRADQMSRQHDAQAALNREARAKLAEKDPWRGLWDSQWVNIVNNPGVLGAASKEDAVDLAVKLTEARLKANNMAITSQAEPAHQAAPETRVERAAEAIYEADKQMWMTAGSYQDLHADDKRRLIAMSRAALAANSAAGACEGCNGHGEVGGLLPGDGGYHSEVCPFCHGSGEQEHMTQHLGPNDYAVTGPCSGCNGTGVPAAAPDARGAPDAEQALFLQESDQHLLHRFIETTEDDESYDIGKDGVKRLAELGVISNHGFGRYSVTMFGYWVHEQFWHQNPSLPLKTNSDRDHEARAAIAAQEDQKGD